MAAVASYTQKRFQSSVDDAFTGVTFTQCSFTGGLPDFKDCIFRECRFQITRVSIDRLSFVKCEFADKSELHLRNEDGDGGEEMRQDNFLCDLCKFEDTVLSVMEIDILFARRCNFVKCNSRTSMLFTQNCTWDQCGFVDTSVVCHQTSEFKRCRELPVIVYNVPACVKLEQCDVPPVLKVRDITNRQTSQLTQTVQPRALALILKQCTLGSQQFDISSYQNTLLQELPSLSLLRRSTGFTIEVVPSNDSLYITNPAFDSIASNVSIHLYECVSALSREPELVIGLNVGCCRSLTIYDTPVQILRDVNSEYAGSPFFTQIGYSPEKAGPALSLINMHGVVLLGDNVPLGTCTITTDFAPHKWFELVTRDERAAAVIHELKDLVNQRRKRLKRDRRAARGARRDEIRDELYMCSLQKQWLKGGVSVTPLTAELRVTEFTCTDDLFWAASQAEMGSRQRQRLEKDAVFFGATSVERDMSRERERKVTQLLTLYNRMGTLMYLTSLPGVNYAEEVEAANDVREHDGELHHYLSSLHFPTDDEGGNDEEDQAHARQADIHDQFRHLIVSGLNDELEKVPNIFPSTENEAPGDYMSRRILTRLRELRGAPDVNEIKRMSPLAYMLLEKKVELISEKVNEYNERDELRLTDLQKAALNYALSQNAMFVLTYVTTFLDEAIAGYPTFVAQWRSVKERDEAVVRANYKSFAEKNFAEFPASVVQQEGETLQDARMRAVRAWTKTGAPLTPFPHRRPDSALAQEVTYLQSRTPPVTLENLKRPPNVYELPLRAFPSPEESEVEKLHILLAGVSCGAGTLERLVVKLRDVLLELEVLCNGEQVVSADRIARSSRAPPAVGDRVFVWLTMDADVNERTACEGVVKEVLEAESIEDERKPKRARITHPNRYRVEYLTRLDDSMQNVLQIFKGKKSQSPVALLTDEKLAEIRTEFVESFSPPALKAFLARTDQQFWTTVLMFKFIKKAFDDAGMNYNTVDVPPELLSRIGAQLLMYEGAVKDLLLDALDAAEEARIRGGNKRYQHEPFPSFLSGGARLALLKRFVR